MAVLVERSCRHGGMRLHDVRIHVLLRLPANLLHATSGLVAVICAGSNGSLPPSSQPVRWQAGSLSLSLMHGSFERACRGRVNMVCVAIGVFVVCNINNVWRAALPCVGVCVLKIVELHACRRREDACSSERQTSRSSRTMTSATVEDKNDYDG